MRNLFILIPIFAICFSCQYQSQSIALQNDSITNYFQTYPRFAKGFSVEYIDNYKKISVNISDSNSVSYILYPKNSPKPNVSGNFTFIPIPINRVSALYTTQISALARLGIADKIVGVCEPQYIKNNFVKKAISQNKITDLGQSSDLNLEKLINSQTELLLSSPFFDNKYAKINELGINSAIVADYIEPNPIGRAEWIKFIAYFFNKEAVADSICNILSQNYLNLKALTDTISLRPTIFSEKKYSDTWFLPGGKSYMATLFADAGFNYIFAADSSVGSIALDLETVITKAHDANYWCFLTNSSNYSYNDLAAECPAYPIFDAYQNRKIIICDVANKPYFENALFAPDTLLADLISIAHHNILPNHQNIFFELLK